MKMDTYFYRFLENVSKELALVARELEFSIFTSPRTMLTHARVFVENILDQVIRAEAIPSEQWNSLKDRIDLLDKHGYIKSEIRDALHHVRQIGNQAAHDARSFRYSEALISWESVYQIVKWYVEVYGPVHVKVPEYQDPKPRMEKQYDITEIEVRLKSLEKILTESVQQPINDQVDDNTEINIITNESQMETLAPGYTTIRNISYKGEQLGIPHFLRDAFLLPQRFTKSETFLIRLGAEQQARIMSELPRRLEGLHHHVKRFGERNDENLFEELKIFIEEEKFRRKLTLERPGELFLFYKEKHIVLTEKLANVPLTTEEFSGIPSLLRQLKQDQIEMVGQLPRELVILAKYENVGTGTVENLFNQITEK
ncbi:protein of unknown function [Oceanobacillus limi]|uniref:DUF4145 domain-containing protein n=1 Tax=Oceanobacillus limi TaxID=930131 RepID=A0A1I0GC18_9BACI|nr:DUF4145 domain-containing protein [Oceanobacillus limi]SET68445.1 protein of unknown function [Oceanobacillus limi]